MLDRLITFLRHEAVLCIAFVCACVSLAVTGFTQNWHSLLIGVDLGGLGTPIASLASLIALRLYLHVDGARPAAFMREFALVNVVALVLMCVLYAVLFVW